MGAAHSPHRCEELAILKSSENIHLRVPVKQSHSHHQSMILSIFLISNFASGIFGSTAHVPGLEHDHGTLVSDSEAREDTWPQWRGPSRNGQHGGATWPESLDEEHLRLRWKVAGLGPGYAGPIVAVDRVFTVESKDGNETVQAYGRAAGDLLWEVSWEDSMSVPVFAARRGSWVRSTPAWDGEKLYVGGMRDRLVAIDGESGEIVWDVDFKSRYGTEGPEFGLASSPLLRGKHLYVQAGDGVCKVDAATGASLWRRLSSEGELLGSAFSSPILGELGGGEQLVVLTRSHMNGLNPLDGDVLWSHAVKADRGMNILTPLIHDGAVFTAPTGDKSQLLRVVEEEGVFSVEKPWTNKVQGFMTSPVIIKGHAYIFSRANRISCIRLSDGELKWTSPPTGDEYWSLVAQDDQILALADTGILRLIAADPTEYRVESERKVAEDSWGHLAVCSDELFVRDLEFLACFDWNDHAGRD